MSIRYKIKKLGPVEVVIVVFICLFVLAVIWAGSKRSRIYAFRIIGCKKNLYVIGKAMLSYANDCDGKLPRSAGPESMFIGYIQNWRAANRSDAYGLTADSRNKGTNISSCFYLLIKYEGLQPKSFVCPGDSGTTEFKLSGADAGDRKLADLWDFGPASFKHCSYSYQLPIGPYPLTTSSEPGMAVAADRNPWIKSPAAKKTKDPANFNPDGGREAVKAGNAIAHQDEGQNVLFLDGHAVFERQPLCGVANDNIYTLWNGGDIRVGRMPVHGWWPGGRTDSSLVHDRPRPPFNPPPPIRPGDL